MMTTAQRLINESMVKGKLERDKMLVKNMISQGLRVYDISRITGFTKEKT